MFPETSCQCPRPQVITHWWPASVSLSQISIVHSSLLSSVASRSLSFVKHSANIHNLLLFLFLLNSKWAYSLRLKAMYCIDILVDKYFWLMLSEKHFPHSFLPLLWSVGTQDTPVWPYLWYLRPHFITNAYLVYRNKISAANVCILPWLEWRAFSHHIPWFEKIQNNHARRTKWWSSLRPCLILSARQSVLTKSFHLIVAAANT